MPLETALWRNPEIEPVPSGLWILGVYHDPLHGDSRPHPTLRDPAGRYWVVSISRLDGQPTMERYDDPPHRWRYI